jgi:hypothetical protein
MDEQLDWERFEMVALMNTLAIYEQFRAILGEEQAKVFAQTLGTMIDEAKNATTKEDFRILGESIDADVTRLDKTLVKLAEAQVRTEARVEELAQAQTRTETRVEQLAQAQVRTETRVEELAQAQARTEARVEELAQAQVRTEARVEELAQAQVRTEARLDRLEQTVERLINAIEKLVIRSDRHEGTLLELKFRTHLPSYLGRFLRKAKVIDASDLLDTLEPKLASVAVDDVLRADVVATGTFEGNPTYLVGEISYTADEDDVMRAARRAACLAKAGLPVIAMVACEAIPQPTAEYARREGVFVWVDGRVLDAESRPSSQSG